MRPSGLGHRGIQVAKPGLLAGATLQLINPKAYAVHITLFSGFAFYPSDFLVEVTIKFFIANVIWILLHFFWLYAGIMVNQLDLPQQTQRVINFIMAVCLFVVVSLSTWSMLS